MNWQWIITPAMGGIIGYITNDLAIRMLFRPYRPVYVGKRRLPMTPGLIPKEKDRIARSIGQAVGEELFSEEVLARSLTTPDMQEKLAAAWDSAMEKLLAQPESLQGLLAQRVGEEKVDAARQSVINAAARKAARSLESAHLGDAMADAVLEKFSNPMIASLAGRIRPQLARKIEEIIAEKAPDLLHTALSDMADDFLARPVGELAQAHENLLLSARAFFFEHYEAMVVSLLSRILPAIDLAHVAETQIASFQPEELEALIMQLAKKELKAIVWLGAILGLVMGFASALVNVLL